MSSFASHCLTLHGEVLRFDVAQDTGIVGVSVIDVCWLAGYAARYQERGKTLSRIKQPPFQQ
jgi:hypothetical protein